MDAAETKEKGEESEAKPLQEDEIVKLKKQLEEERERAEQYLNQLKYLQADFDNYCKQSKKWTEETIKFANELLITKLLKVIDTLELAIKSAREAADREALIKGVEITLKSFENILKEEGLEKIESLGKKFDPTFHQAVEQVITNDPPDDIVIEELRKGYIFKGKVIRPSMVKVAKLLKDDPNPKMREDDIKSEQSN